MISKMQRDLFLFLYSCKMWKTKLHFCALADVKFTLDSSVHSEPAVVRWNVTAYK